MRRLVAMKASDVEDYFDNLTVIVTTDCKGIKEILLGQRGKMLSITSHYFGEYINVNRLEYINVDCLEEDVVEKARKS